ncbi:MAG: MarR family winged helix-turn-helix transcriptional regulator [Kofleriaceae bacterium]
MVTSYRNGSTSKRASRRTFNPTDVLVALRRIVRWLRLADREAELACGVSAAQLFVLHRLAAGPAPSLARLAEWTLTDQSSVSTVVSRLVAGGYVARTPSRVDRRRAELRLTAAGRRLLATAPPIPQAHLLAALTMMPRGEGADIVRALQRLICAIGADDVSPHMLFEDEPPPRKKPRHKR